MGNPVDQKYCHPQIPRGRNMGERNSSGSKKVKKKMAKKNKEWLFSANFFGVSRLSLDPCYLPWSQRMKYHHILKNWTSGNYLVSLPRPTENPINDPWIIIFYPIPPENTKANPMGYPVGHKFQARAIPRIFFWGGGANFAHPHRTLTGVSCIQISDQYSYKK